MKKVNYILGIFLYAILIISNLAFAQNTEIDKCFTNVNSIQQEPEYLSASWKTSQTIQLAVIYFDFPDGRRSDNGEQPIYTSDLQYVPNFDAAGEIGLTNDLSPYVVSGNSHTLYTNAAKYSWQDRYNMFFDITNTYQGSAHPDYQTHNSMYGDQAYGSMRQYWKEVSSNMLDVIPATTHPNSGNDYQGIVNDYITLPNGKQIIKYITLDKNKYGPEATSYMPDYYWYTYTNPPIADDVSRLQLMQEDMIKKLKYMYSHGQTPFDYTSFNAAGGKCIFVFAGSSYRFKGLGFSDGIIVRDMNAKPDEIACRIDGFSNMAHEFGHSAFGWGHTVSGRYDLMNVFMTRDLNCPSHPNPVYKLRKGWLDAVPYEHSMTETNLPPIETSNKCGIVTIYGKPTVSPDHLAGECFILENRKRIGFDRQIVTDNINDFKGGLLIWHYSPYTPQPVSSCSGEDPTIIIKPADPTVLLSQMCGSIGNPLHFFAHADVSGAYKSFLTQRTFSGENLKTGIQLTNINQNDYSNVNSGISFTLQYTISEPPDYQHVVYNRGSVPQMYSLSDKVYYHENDPNANYIFYENTEIEGVAGRSFVLGPFKSRTHDNNPILFKGANYANTSESYINTVAGIECRGTSQLDSIVVENIKLQNTNGNIRDFTMFNTGGTNPIVLRNINVSETNYSDPDFYDIALVQNRNYSKIDLSNCNIYLASTGVGAEIDNDISLHSANLKVGNVWKFKNNSGIVLDNSSIYSVVGGGGVTLSPKNVNETWKGIQLTGGNIIFSQVTLSNALTGIEANYIQHMDIENCVFNNSIAHDIVIQNAHPDLFQVDILNNTFNCNSNYQYTSIGCSDVDIAHIRNNTLNNIGQFGIAMLNCPYGDIYGNTITGANSNDGYSTGIVGYASGGSYNCNSISNCMQYGVLLDNSQPVLYSNQMENNGVGLFLTNNSHPLMTPGYTINQTYEIGGSNHIFNSAGPEIYCDNDKNYNSDPIINNGHNIIEDYLHSGGDQPDTLIFNSEIYVTPPMIYCSGNAWGGNPSGRLVPAYSFSYKNYADNFDFTPCGFGVINEDNSEIPQSELLLGNFMVSRNQNNNNAALGYAYDLYNLQDTNFSKVVALNNIFYTSVINNSDLSTLESFYSNIANSSTDTIISKRSRDLKIETKVEEEFLTPAVNDYENIINTSGDDKEIFYANLNKSRVYRLIIDSLLAHYHEGDNFENIGLMNLVNNAIIKGINTNLKIKSIGAKIDVKNSVITNIFLNKLKSQVTSKLSELDRLSNNEKKMMLLNNRLVQLAIHNYNANIGSIQ
ncbi:MAG: hypothetical protein JST55_16570, partial [Bacteroidetes bacterium]|nr:hypothetical protein [Bacteroidota bacterium]